MLAPAMPDHPSPTAPEDPLLDRLVGALSAEAAAAGHDAGWAEAEGVSRLLVLRPALPAAEARWLVREALAAARRRSPPRHLLLALARPAMPRRAPPSGEA